MPFNPALINSVYFSDGYGLKKVEIADLVGESQSEVTTVLSTTTTPAITSDDIAYIHGEYIAGNFYLALAFGGVPGLNWGDFIWGLDVWGSFDSDGIWGHFYWGDSWGGDPIGCVIAKNETESLNQYVDGYFVTHPKINNRGILYLVKLETNSVEVYYGVHNRAGERDPDFIYNTTSTPALFPGDITYLHITNDSSSVFVNGTRLYVGTTLGLTRIDACDMESIDGYSVGWDGYGVATTYSIDGYGATYEILGGTVPIITAISSDENKDVMLVATGNGHGTSGGLTQVLMTDNTRVIFMTYANSLVPSNNIRDINK